MKGTAGVILTGTFPLAVLVAGFSYVPVHAAHKKAIELGDRRELLVMTSSSRNTRIWSFACKSPSRGKSC